MTVVTAQRFTIAEYQRLAELGFFREDERVELIKGEVIQMTAKVTPYCVCETLLCQELIQLLLGRAMVRGQQPIIIPDHSEPEPDLTIVRNVNDNYLSSHPKASEILLLIEISNSILKYYQEVKLPLYAEAGISEYWIFNLINHRLEFYSEPCQGYKSNFDYRRSQIDLIP
jgi:Uma2 family endonuclease